MRYQNHLPDFFFCLPKTEWMDATGKKIISNENNSNVILVDYSVISDCNYMYLATKVVYELSESLAKSIKQWELDLNRTRIIGFSVGAHIGKDVQISSIFFHGFFDICFANYFVF